MIPYSVTPRHATIFGHDFTPWKQHLCYKNEDGTYRVRDKDGNWCDKLTEEHLLTHFVGSLVDLLRYDRAPHLFHIGNTTSGMIPIHTQYFVRRVRLK
jgi:hypothetical protein